MFMSAIPNSSYDSHDALQEMAKLVQKGKKVSTVKMGVLDCVMKTELESADLVLRPSSHQHGVSCDLHDTQVHTTPVVSRAAQHARFIVTPSRN